MSIFNLKNQPFKSSDFFVLLALVGLVGSASGAVVSEILADTRPHEAKQQAHLLAQRLASSRLANAEAADLYSADQRAPASVEDHKFERAGELGTDPWGHPYHYIIMQGEMTGAQAKVAVWSDGPKGQATNLNSKDLASASPFKAGAIGEIVSSP